MMLPGMWQPPLCFYVVTIETHFRRFPCISLRPSYALPGTDIPYAISLRPSYALPRTGIPYAISLRPSYAVPGTDIPYGMYHARY
eukprot:758244-Rhodomonas_salina.3